MTVISRTVKCLLSLLVSRVIVAICFSSARVKVRVLVVDLPVVADSVTLMLWNYSLTCLTGSAYLGTTLG